MMLFNSQFDKKKGSLEGADSIKLVKYYISIIFNNI